MKFEPATLRENLPAIATMTLFTLFVLFLPRYSDIARTWYALLLLGGLFYLLFNLREVVSTSVAERVFIGAVLFNFLWIAFCYYANGAPERGHSFLWGRHIYFALLIPMFFLFRKFEFSDRNTLLLLVASVTFALLDIAIDVMQGIDYQEQGMNPNSLGAIQHCLFWTMLFYSLQEKQRLRKLLALAGCLMAFVVIIASGSKNTWLCFLLVSLFFLFYLTPMAPVRKGLLALVFVLLSSGLYLVPYVKFRVDLGFESIERYFSGEVQPDAASMGTFEIRMELWKEAWHVFLDKPLVGAGLGGVKPMVEANRDRYQTSEQVAGFKYVHNQYLSALATRGVPGLILFLLVLTTPLYIAMTHKSRQGKEQVARLSIIALCLIYGIGSVFASYFEAKSAIMFTSIMLPFWLARLSRAKAG